MEHNAGMQKKPDDFLLRLAKPGYSIDTETLDKKIILTHIAAIDSLTQGQKEASLFLELKMCMWRSIVCLDVTR